MMSAHTPDEELDLAGLLTALREAGITVGVAETARIQRVFELAPAAAEQARPQGDQRERLGSLLRAVLVKTREDRQRFERVFATWLPRAAPTPPRRHRDRQLVPVPQPDFGSERRSRVPAIVTIALLIGLAALVVRFLPGMFPGDQPISADATRADAGALDAGALKPKPRPVVDPAIATTDDPPDPPSACAPAAMLDLTYLAITPELTELGGRSPWAGYWPLALAIIGLLAAIIGYVTLRNRRLLRDPEPLPDAHGQTRTLLQPAVLTGPALLDAREREALVWGVGRFVSELPTRRLDIPATVQAIARDAGMPHAVFLRAHFHRTVWLWTDESTDDPAVHRLADEIAEALQTHGLPVERARFRGVPDRLTRAEGGVFTPRDVDERRHSATVVIMTDSRVLAARHASVQQRHVQAFLRNLAHWPRLAVVDFSPAGRAELARDYGLTVIKPSQLADFLSDVPAADRRLRRPVPVRDWQLSAWAAVCALCPAPVPESSALLIRQELGLSVSPLMLAALGREAAAADGRLHWTGAARVRRVRWLRLSEHQRSDAASMLQQALAFWRGHYEQQRAALAQDPSWSRSPAQRWHTMEEALLDLWHSPEPAARTLYGLWQGPLKAPITEHLQQLCTADGALTGTPASERIPVLWRRAECDEQMFVALQTMGFAHLGQRESLRRPGRLWLGLGMVLGVALAALWYALGQLSTPPAQPVVIGAEAGPVPTWTEIQPLAGERWRVAVVRPHASYSIEVGAHARVQVSWPESGQVSDVSQAQYPCVIGRRHRFSAGELWRCGASYQAPAVRTETARRVAVVTVSLQADPNALEAARELAQALIDCRHRGKELSADVVYLGGQPWAEVREQVFDDPGQRETASLVVAEGEIQAQLTRVRAQGCGSGVQLARIPGGPFWMGTRAQDRDEQAGSNESPARRIQVSSFAMSRCEVSNRQYRGFLAMQPDDRRPANESGRVFSLDEENPRFTGPDQPVAGVTWHEADAFCRHYGMALPTEAEWEYACRLGNERPDLRGPYPFPADKLAEYAWYSGHGGSRTHTVGSLKPTAGGEVFDLHGNAFEWVADWYGDYPARETPDDEQAIDAVNPVQVNGSAKLLRGGAFNFRAGDARCAYRVWFRPEFRSRSVGFRCVRDSGRQP